MFYGADFRKRLRRFSFDAKGIFDRRLQSIVSSIPQPASSYGIGIIYILKYKSFNEPLIDIVVKDFTAGMFKSRFHRTNVHTITVRIDGKAVIFLFNFLIGLCVFRKGHYSGYLHSAQFRVKACRITSGNFSADGIGAIGDQFFQIFRRIRQKFSCQIVG